MPAKTIDNLGPEVHKRYIDDVKLLSDEEIQKIFKTPNIATRVEELQRAPQLKELEILWGLKESESFIFAPPPGFAISADLFTYQLIPSFGSIKDIIEKLQLSKKASDKKKKAVKEKDLSDEENQKQHLLKFANVLLDLNKILFEIKKRKEEYHKG